MQRFSVTTRQRIEIIDITGKISPSIENGVIVLHLPHTTAGLTINEHEPNLRKDMETFYSSLAKGDWQHNRIDNNAEAHLVSTALSNSLTIPVENREMVLGTWQSILFVELDGPRERTVYIKEMKA